MPGPAARKGLWALGAAVAVIALILVGLPVLASTQIVRDGIARQMSAWSGYRVTLGEAPDIRVWPSFRAVLTDVSLTPWAKPDAPAVIEAERIEVELSALAALRGDIVFTRMLLVRPLMRVEPASGPLPLPASPGGGKLLRSVTQARGLIDADPANPQTSILPSDPLGTIEVQGGRLVAGTGDEEREVITGVAATLNWPALNRPSTISATGIWHGESVTFNATATEPLILLAGGNAPVKMSIKAAPLNVSFEGVANISEKSFADGQLSLNSPSLRRAVQWLRANITPGNAIGSIALTSRVTGSATRLKFENTEITLDGNPAKGVLDVSLGETTPQIAGTLAFNTLDLRSFLSAFTPLPSPPGTQQQQQRTETSLADQFNLDLRLSANTAKAGSVQLSGVAATAQVRDGLATFDISEATAFGGMIQFGMRIDRKMRSSQAELRIVADNIDGAQLASTLGMSRIVPQTRCSFSIILKGQGRDWSEMLDHADGAISATLGQGTLKGIDLAAFLQRSKQGEFFALSEIAGGSLPIERMELKASVSEGIARIEKAEALSGQSIISLGGLIPLAGRGIALSGTVAPAEAAARDGAAARHASFFVGGSWSAPFIAPVMPSLPTD